MGIRFRHEVADNWLVNKTTILEVVENLNKGFFDPEFFKTYSKEIKQHFIRILSKYKILEMEK